MKKSEQLGRPLSEAQRQHLTFLISNMRIAAAKLGAAKSIMEAQVEMAQKDFDSCQSAANAFLQYCGNEHQITFDDGRWSFDEQLMCFVHHVPDTMEDVVAVMEPPKVAEMRHNGKE